MNHQIKLIGIHKKNLGILQEQKSHYGMHCPMHVQSQIDFEEEAIVEIETEMKKRLNGLMLKAASYGISVDPSVTIEIEDIQEYFNVE